jgi:hypothetical protein
MVPLGLAAGTPQRATGAKAGPSSGAVENATTSALAAAVLCGGIPAATSSAIGAVRTKAADIHFLGSIALRPEAHGGCR